MAISRSSPDQSSGVVSSRVWVRITHLCPSVRNFKLKICNQNCFVRSWEGTCNVVYSAPPTRLLVDDTCMPTPLRYVKGVTLFQPYGVVGNMPLVAVDLGRQLQSKWASPHLKVAIRRCDVKGDFSQKQITVNNNS